MLVRFTPLTELTFKCLRSVYTDPNVIVAVHAPAGSRIDSKQILALKNHFSLYHVSEPVNLAGFWCCFIHQEVSLPLHLVNGFRAPQCIKTVYNGMKLHQLYVSYSKALLIEPVWWGYNSDGEEQFAKQLFFDQC